METEKRKSLEKSCIYNRKEIAEFLGISYNMLARMLGGFAKMPDELYLKYINILENHQKPKLEKQ